MDAGAFYDGLAEHYHLIFRDWASSMERQAALFDHLIAGAFGKVGRIHDASAGIGTQALGLAARGYRVSASDLSAQAIARLRREAAQRGVACPASVCDMRRLDTTATGGPVEVAVSLDNSLPHLLCDEDILAALAALRRIASRGVVVSLRDYDAVDPTIGHQQIYEPKKDHGDLVTLFQLWDFTPGTRVYRLRMYMVRDNLASGEVTSRCWQTSYYAITTAHLAELFTTAGFTGVEILRNAFYQPVIIGRV